MSPKLACKSLLGLFFAAFVLSAVLPAATPASAQSDRECPARCIHQLQQVFDECVGNGGDPLACARRAQEALAKCLKECQPPAATPKPSAPGCQDKCREKSNAALKECLEHGGSQADCEVQAKNVFTDCMKGCTPAATKQPSCRGSCEQKRVEAIKACMANGGTEEQCKKDAEPAYQECLKACPTEVPKATPLTCEGKCSQRSQEVYKKCINDGGTEAECQARAKAELESCLQNQCKPKATPVPSCGSLCEREAEAHYKDCINLGGTPETCKAAMEAELKECRAKCPTATPKPTELSCTGRCEKKANEVYEKCIKDAGSEEDCRARQKAAYAECVKGCEPKASPTPTCRGLCEQAAKKVYDDCRAAGGGEDECDNQRRAAFEACAAKCPTATPKPTEKPSCQDDCLGKARAAYTTCRTTTDKSVEDCWALAVSALRDCMKACFANTEVSCTGLCAKLREPVVKLCKSIDGVDSCEDRAAKVVADCAKDCPVPTPKPGVLAPQLR